MQVQIEYFERKTVLTNLMILKEKNIPVLQIKNENQYSNKTSLHSLSMSMDTDDIMIG